MKIGRHLAPWTKLHPRGKCLARILRWKMGLDHQRNNSWKITFEKWRFWEHNESLRERIHTSRQRVGIHDSCYPWLKSGPIWRLLQIENIMSKNRLWDNHLFRLKSSSDPGSSVRKWSILFIHLSKWRARLIHGWSPKILSTFVSLHVWAGLGSNVPILKLNISEGF